MRTTGGVRKLALAAVLAGFAAVVGAAGCALFQSEQVARGQQLYTHYCMHCHGEHGRQNEGFNWSSMPDPRPKDLSNKSEMETFKDEEIFATISRAMKDTSPEGGEKIGDDEFAVPTMPTFKYTLSEEEIWAIVAYVRALQLSQHASLEDVPQDERESLAATPLSRHASRGNGEPRRGQAATPLSRHAARRNGEPRRGQAATPLSRHASRGSGEPRRGQAALAPHGDGR